MEEEVKIYFTFHILHFQTSTSPIKEEEVKILDKSEDIKQEVHDPLEEVNVENSENPRHTYMSNLLLAKGKQDIVAILHEFKDCFAWEDHERLRIDPTIIMHELPIKPDF